MVYETGLNINQENGPFAKELIDILNDGDLKNPEDVLRSRLLKRKLKSSYKLIVAQKCRLGLHHKDNCYI